MRADSPTGACPASCLRTVSSRLPCSRLGRTTRKDARTSSSVAPWRAGKTEGLHERRISVPPKAAGYWRSGHLEPIAHVSQQRIEQAGQLRKALRTALMVLFQNGPERANFKPADSSSSKRANPFLDSLEAEIDRDFFERLFEEIEMEGDAAQREVRARWLKDLRKRAEMVLTAAEAGSLPQSAITEPGCGPNGRLKARSSPRSATPIS